jgi:hypothetical protein
MNVGAISGDGETDGTADKFSVAVSGAGAIELEV